MKYQAPYGSVDPDAPYVDRSTPDAVQGSKVPAKAVEHPQREIVAVIAAAGISPDAGDTTQLLQALQYFFGQFPIYPECLNSDGTFDVSQPSTGTIRVPAGIAWVMRGAIRYQTDANVNLTTIGNKTYHLRWDKANGFRLRDLADLTYNPTSATEDNAGFDSTYDDVLVARVVTNGSNVATITNLINKARLAVMQNKRIFTPAALFWTVRTGTGIVLNWARAPVRASAALSEIRNWSTGPTAGVQTPAGKGVIVAVGVRVSNAAPPTRYQCSDFEYYYEDDQYGAANEDGAVTVVLSAEAN